MRTTRYLTAAMLLIVVATAPLVRWPLSQPSAYANGLDIGGPIDTVRRIIGPLFGRSVAASNENEQKDRDDRRDRGNNGNSNDNDQGDQKGDYRPPPAPQAAPAPPPPSDGCLQNGQS